MGDILVSNLKAVVEYVAATPSPSAEFLEQAPRIPVTRAIFYFPSGTVYRATDNYIDSQGQAFLPGLAVPSILREAEDILNPSSSFSFSLRVDIGTRQPSGGITSNLPITYFTDNYEVRGSFVAVYHYDPENGEYNDADIEMSGRIESYVKNDQYVEFQIMQGDDPALDIMLPTQTVTADLFDPTALGINTPVNMPFGECSISCPNIENDTVNDEYKYLLSSSGIISVTKVYRDGFSVNSSQYSVENGLFHDYLLFDKEQKNFGGGFAEITADVVGFRPRYKVLMVVGNVTYMTPSTDPPARHMVDVAKMLLTRSDAVNDDYGVDEDSVEAAKEALGGEEGEWYTTLNIGGVQKRAGEWLRDIFQGVPIKWFRGYNRKWHFQVDNSIPTVTHYAGFRDGFYNNCELKQEGKNKTSETIRKITLRFHYFMYRGEEKYYEIFATANSSGVDKIVELRAIGNTTTAKKILSRMIQEAKYSGGWVELQCGPFIRTAKENELLYYYTSYPSTYKVYQIQRIQKKYTESFFVRAKDYNSALYSQVDIEDPVIPDLPDEEVRLAAIPITYIHPDGTVQTVQNTPQELARFPVGGMYNGVIPEADWTLFCYELSQKVIFPEDLTGSKIYVDPIKTGSAATAETVLLIKKYTAATETVSQIGTATFAAAGMVATISFTSAVTFLSGDIFYLIGPATPDSTLGDLRYSFVGVKESV